MPYEVQIATLTVRCGTIDEVEALIRRLAPEAFMSFASRVARPKTEAVDFGTVATTVAHATTATERVVAALSEVVARGERGATPTQIAARLHLENPKGVGPVMSAARRRLEQAGFRPELLLSDEVSNGDRVWRAHRGLANAISVLDQGVRLGEEATE